MESIEAEALARNDRYLREFVEALELCPFARRCRESGRLARRFLRRSPDPTLQLVRIATLERVRSGRPAGSVYVDPSKLRADELRSLEAPLSVSEQIARANLRTLRQHDAAGLQRLLAGFQAR